MVEKLGSRQTSMAAEAVPAVVNEAKGPEVHGKKKNPELESGAEFFEAMMTHRKEMLNLMREEGESILKQMVGLGLMDEATAKKESQKINGGLKTQEEAFFRAKNGVSKIRDFNAENREKSKAMGEGMVFTREMTAEEIAEDKKEATINFFNGVGKAADDMAHLQSEVKSKVDLLEAQASEKLIDVGKLKGFGNTLKERYERGEIDKGTYRQRLEVVKSRLKKLKRKINKLWRGLRLKSMVSTQRGKLRLKIKNMTVLKRNVKRSMLKLKRSVRNLLVMEEEDLILSSRRNLMHLKTSVKVYLNSSAV